MYMYMQVVGQIRLVGSLHFLVAFSVRFVLAWCLVLGWRREAEFTELPIRLSMVLPISKL